MKLFKSIRCRYKLSSYLPTCILCSKPKLYHAYMTKYIKIIHSQGAYQFCEFWKNLNHVVADIKKHIKNIHRQGTYQHCDFCWRPNPFVADIDKYTKNKQSQCTFQHCDCCIKPNEFGADMKKHIDNIYSQVDIWYMQSSYST